MFHTGVSERQYTDVRVSSPYTNVMINGSAAHNTGERDGKNYIFRRRIWLKSGFNKIDASCESPQGAQYTDSVSLFYYKDNKVFRFVTPANREVFKTGGEVRLPIKGEIGSAYKSEGVPNTVTLKVIYRPDNPLLSLTVSAGLFLAGIALASRGLRMKIRTAGLLGLILLLSGVVGQ